MIGKLIVILSLTSLSLSASIEDKVNYDSVAKLISEKLPTNLNNLTCDAEFGFVEGNHAYNVFMKNVSFIGLDYEPTVLEGNSSGRNSHSMLLNLNAGDPKVSANVTVIKKSRSDRTAPPVTLHINAEGYAFYDVEFNVTLDLNTRRKDISMRKIGSVTETKFLTKSNCFKYEEDTLCEQLSKRIEEYGWPYVVDPLFERLGKVFQDMSL